VDDGQPNPKNKKHLAELSIVLSEMGLSNIKDELFENLTLIQTNKIVKKVPVVLFGKEFFNNLFNLDLLVKYSLIKQEDLDTILITDSIEEAFNYVISNIQPYDA
jgi:predicted Rossmann-fold nucleotide-binding protein